MNNNEQIEIENEEQVKFTMDKNSEDNQKLKIDEQGLPIRTSHSNYIGMRLDTEDGKSVYSHTALYAPPKCYVSKSNIHEHGVFAAKDFVSGECIEEMKTIILDTTTKSCKDWVLNRYAWVWDCDCDICNMNGKTMYMPTGNGLVYNHSNTPNAYIQLEKPFKRVKMIALRTIRKDEEITWYYGKEMAKRFQDISKLHPRSDIPEGMPAAFTQAMTKTPCTTCGKNSIDSLQFRSMIVPESIIE
jgi:hypothetical protein